MPTNDNLKEAFAGESQANRKYLAFAKKAANEGWNNIAKLFIAAAEAETVHAHAHMRAMNAIKSTEENLQEAAGGESYEFKEMYPKFVKEAENEGHKQALRSFQNAMAVEQVHHSLYNEALAAVKKGEDLQFKTIYVCDVCGNTVIDEVPEKCPICGSPKEKFKEIK